MNEPEFLTLSDVGITFADTNEEVLSGIHLKVPAGSFTAVVGRSGVGKSTLLRIIGGLLPPSQGEVRLRGSDPRTSSAPIGIVFQRDNLMPWRTVAENVGLPLEIIKGDWETGRLGDSSVSRSPNLMVSSSLALVELAEHGASYPAQLSGGMAQRVALARALVHQPELLLLDEPFGALDALTRERMAQELLRIWQAAHPVTVLMVTHSITEAVLLADEVLVMNDRPGRITDRIPIDLPRPRSLDIEATVQFQRYAKMIRLAIRE